MSAFLELSCNLLNNRQMSNDFANGHIILCIDHVYGWVPGTPRHSQAQSEHRSRLDTCPSVPGLSDDRRGDCQPSDAVKYW